MNVLKCVVVLCVGWWFSLSAFADELKVNGVYNGINLHVQNPHDGNNNYCISAIYLNNAQVKFANATMITIDLSNLKIGEKVELKILHREKCTPKILNPNALLPRGDFHFGKLKIDAEAIQWEGRGETEQGQYFLEAFKNSAWVAEKVMPAQGSKGVSTYLQKVSHISGINKYRIKYLDTNSNKSYFSDELEFTSDKDKVYFFPKSVSNAIYFSKVVKYEVLDANKKSVLKGSGAEIDCSSLVTGTYYVLYENKTEPFYKKPN
jgi:hypothetical protein